MRLFVLVATHLLAVALGAFLWWDRALDLNDGDPGMTSHADGSVESPLKNRLQSIAHEAAEQDREYQRFGELDLADQVAESLAEEKEANRIANARHLELVGLSHAFDRMDRARLNQVLTNSLIRGDTETAQALFLSWYRHDAFEALDQLVLRPALLSLVAWEPAVALGFDPESVGRWAAQESLPDEARDCVLEGMAESLASHDDLDGLETLWSLMNSEQHENVAYCFASGWIPDEGASAVDTLFSSVPGTLRDAIIENMAPKAFMGCGLGGGWLDSPLFASSPALDGDLIEAVLEHDLSHLDDVAERFTDYLAQENEEEAELVPSETDDEAEVSWTADQAQSQIEGSIADWLITEKDFPELIMAGGASIDDAWNSVVEQVPAAGEHPDVLKRQLFAKVFLHAPEKARSWASTHLSADEEAEALHDEFSHFNEPRAAMRQRWLENMPDAVLEDQDPFGFQRSDWDEVLAEWEQLKGTDSATEEP